MRCYVRAICIMMISSFVWADTHTVAPEKVEKSKPSKEEVFSEENIRKVSETYGHFVYKILENPVLKLNFDAVVKGLHAAKTGQDAPMTEQEYEEAISNMQEYAFQEMATKNLEQAEEFLQRNHSAQGVIEIEPGKLQILDLQVGSGASVVEEDSPTIHYVGTYADGTVWGNSYEVGEPIAISLKHTIAGFRRGVVGMKVGGKRRLFIHPELGYGTSGQMLPNALLVFDIEVVKLSSPAEEAAENTTSISDKSDEDDCSSDSTSDDCDGNDGCDAVEGNKI